MKPILEHTLIFLFCLVLAVGCTHNDPYRVSDRPGTPPPSSEPPPAAEKDEPAPSPGQEAQEGETGKEAVDRPDIPESKNEEILDSALDFYQAATDYWEEGDLDHALG